MNKQNFSSLLTSTCLHVGIIVLVLLWPSPKPLVIDAPSFIVGDLVTINPGIEGTKSQRSNKPSLQPNNKAIENNNKPDRQNISDKPIVENQNTSSPEPEIIPEPETKPEPKPEPTPEPAPEPKPEPAPAPKPEDPNAVKIGKEEPKPEPTKPEPAKPSKVKDNNKKDAKPQKTKPAKSAKSAKSTKPSKPNSNKNDATKSSSSSGKSISDALASLKDEISTDGGSDVAGQGSGGGGSGIGILGAYNDYIASQISANWNYPPQAGREKIVTVVNITIADDGTITSAKIVKSSGNPSFDNSILNAINLTKKLDPPPSEAAKDTNIEFSQNML